MLEQLGYSDGATGFHHPTRQAVFCGDFIDRGPQIRDVIRIVRTMVGYQGAHAVMGNHEFNAIAFHTKRSDQSGDWFRAHSTRHVRQHQATLDQLDEDELDASLDWFRSLPVALDLGTMRVVHACWDPELIRVLETWLDRDRLGRTFLSEALDSETSLRRAVERVLKGPEARLPEGVTVRDKEGHARRQVRIRWFEPTNGHNLGSYAFPATEELADVSIPDSVCPCPYPADAVPLFIGHYWLKSHSNPLLLPNLACLDLSVAKGGVLCGYRFNGESALNADALVKIPVRNGQALR